MINLEGLVLRAVARPQWGGGWGGQCAEGSAAPCCRAQEETGEDAGELEVKRTLKDEITRLTHIKASAKIRSV